MTRIFLSLFLLFSSLSAALAQEEDVVWVQVEAHASLTVASDRIRTYSQDIQDVNGFTLGGGWYAVALGPYTRDDAETVLQVYRAERIIPRDSFIALSGSFGQQFWPVGANLLQPLQPAPSAVETETPAAVAEEEVTPEVVDETPREARASESRLNREERRELQSLLKWAGFYNSAIDGAFGRGTRASMSDWQAANGYEITGIMTTLQRAALTEQYNAVLKGMDLQIITEAEAGIELQLPMGVLNKANTEFPFVHYNASGDIDAQVLLISQAGDQTTLFGLYEIMQTLAIVPLEGPRERKKNSFVLIGEDGRMISHTEVSLKNGQIKGFTLAWPAGDEERRRRILGVMQKSFARLDRVLDSTAGSDAQQSIDLVSGLEVRKPRLSRSGFYVDGKGTVVTTAEVVSECTRITLDNDYDAELLGNDAASGIAVLRPKETLAPITVAQFRKGDPRLQSEIAVAGYSFGGVLGAPTLTFGTLEELQGLRGEQGVTRLALAPLAGDAGGPVFDTAGAVVGMLLPKPVGSAQQLPEDVSFAVVTPMVRDVLSKAGIVTATQSSNAALAPEDLTTQASGMTVLVSCWN